MLGRVPLRRDPRGRADPPAGALQEPDRSRSRRSALFMTGMGMFGAILFIPLFMQGGDRRLGHPIRLAADPDDADADRRGASSAGSSISRLGRYKVLAFAGLAIMAAGLLLMAGMHSDTTQAIVVRNMVVVGFGLGLAMPLYTLIVQNAVERRVLGAATAATQFFRSDRRHGRRGDLRLDHAQPLQRHFDADVPTGVPASRWNRSGTRCNWSRSCRNCRRSSRRSRAASSSCRRCWPTSRSHWSTRSRAVSCSARSCGGRLRRQLLPEGDPAPQELHRGGTRTGAGYRGGAP